MNILIITNPDSFVIPKYIDEVLLYLSKDVNISIISLYPILHNINQDYYGTNSIAVIDSCTNNKILNYFSNVRIINVFIRWAILYGRVKK